MEVRQMFEFIPIEKQMKHTQSEAQLTQLLAEHNAANIDYLAMMADIDMDQDEPEQEVIEGE